MKEIKVIRNYSFWRHPIKWFKDRKAIAVLNQVVNYQWENWMKEEVHEAQRNMMLYGTSIIKK